MYKFGIDEVGYKFKYTLCNCMYVYLLPSLRCRVDPGYFQPELFVFKIDQAKKNANPNPRLELFYIDFRQVLSLYCFILLVYRGPRFFVPQRGLGFTNIAVGSGEGGNYPLSDPRGALPPWIFRICKKFSSRSAID